MNLSLLSPFLIALLLPLFTFGWIVPKGVIQLDLLVLWLVAMVLTGLPLVFGEFALAKRSGKGPLIGMQMLTREADTSLAWRVFSGLAVLVAVLLSVCLIGVLAIQLSQLFGVPVIGASFALAITALIAGFFKDKLLPLATVLTLVGVGISLPNVNLNIAMTDSNIGEWGLAVALVLASVGTGLGLYWFSAKDHIAKHLTHRVLSVWLLQLVFGFLAFLVLSVHFDGAGLIAYGLGAFLLASFLLHYSTSQATARFGMVKGVILIAILVSLTSILPQSVLSGLVVVLGFVASLVLAIFAGWKMKISHLRKTFEFKSEMRYNLWRIGVRVLAPLCMITGFIGFLISWLS